MNSELLAELLGPDASIARRALSGEVGVVLPPFVDHHVHLHLVDERSFGRFGIAGVVDLGGDPVALARRPKEAMPHVAYAGAFLTVPGGYPAGRSWAPRATVREISDASAHPGVHGGAATAVDEQQSFGASVIKITLNTDAGPVFDEATLRAVVAVAHDHDLPVVAHVQGEGTAGRAIEAGVDVLAHTPFSELLDTALIERAAAAGQRWISTLAIHRGDARGLEIATANLAAFRAAGGVVLYGTDLGNGDLPVGVNPEELAALHHAGVQGPALIDALCAPWPLTERSHGVCTFVPGAAPQDTDGLPAWLAGATVVPTEELIHDDVH